MSEHKQDFFSPTNSLSQAVHPAESHAPITPHQKYTVQSAERRQMPRSLPQINKDNSLGSILYNSAFLTSPPVYMLNYQHDVFVHAVMQFLA